MKKCLLMALLAGAAASTVAVAQEAGPLPFGGEVRADPIGFPSRNGGYSQRSIQSVYDCLSNTFGNGSSTHLGACSNILEDISFTSGPWATPGAGHVITEITYGVGVLTTPTVDEQLLLIFWDKDDVNFGGFTGVGTGMINTGATPLAVVRVGLGGLGAGFYWQVTSALTGLPGGGVTVPDTDDGVALQVAWVNAGYTPTAANWVPLDTNASGGLYQGCASATNLALVFGSNSGAAVGGNPAVPGFTSASYGRDISNAAMCPNLGTFVGAAADAPGGDVERRFINATPARGYMVRLKGDVTAPLPTPIEAELGCPAGVPDAGLTQVGSVGASQVKWYKMCLSNDATDGLYQFLDIDSEGSAADVAIGLYDASGGLLGDDDDSGSGTAAQLTFGMGNRAAVGDGLEYNGRTGQLLAGEYYLAVMPNASAFGPAFTANPSANAGGGYTINIHTNTNGSPLAPSVAPQVDPARDVTDLQDPGAQFAAVETGLRGIVWYRWSQNYAAETCNYTDIAFVGSGHTPTADTEAFVFNDQGNIIAASDDEGPALLSQFSFGGSDQPARPSAGGDGIEFAGQNGALAAGTYYMGVGLFDVQPAANQDRWMLRGTSGSNLAVAPQMLTNYPIVTCGGECPACAADFNQDGGVDGSDVEAFYNAWEAGGACGDVNLDGGVDGSDVEAFYSVWEAGGC